MQGPDEDVSIVVNALDRKFNVGLIKDRVAALKKLKEEFSVHSLIFAKFEAEE